MNKMPSSIRRFFFNCIAVAVLLIFILLSHPFLRIPYDVWDHLIKIRNIFDHGMCYLYWPDDPSFMCLWHFLWAQLFRILSISDTLIWARIIHASQFALAAGAVYYYSNTVIRILQPDMQSVHRNALSYFAVLLWFVGNGTYSIVHQQSWITWYSVNYQGLTIPLFWYMSALVLQAFFQNPGKGRRFFILCQVLGISALISAAHPSEQIYFLMHVAALCAVQYKILFSLRARTYLYIAFAGLGGVGLFLLLFKYQLIPMPTAVHDTTWSDAWGKIQWIGMVNVDGGWNRFPNSYSEAAFFSLLAAVPYRIWMFFKPEISSMRKCFDYLLVCSCLFIFIPLSRITSGVIGYVTFSETVWRFVFASPWYLFLPYISYKILSFQKRHAVFYIVAVNAIVIMGLFLLSKFVFYQALSGNIESLISSLDVRKVGLQYSNTDMKKFLEIIEEAEGVQEGTAKPNLLYVRSDLGILAKALYGRDVYMTKVRAPLLTMESFYSQNLDAKYRLIDVDVPPNFPKDREMLRYFNIEKLSLSKRQPITLPEEKENIVFDIDEISQDQKYLRIKGWAFIEGESARGQQVYVVVAQASKDRLVFDTSLNHRLDIAANFGRIDLDETGFIATIKKSDLGKGFFSIGLYIKSRDIYGYVHLKGKEKIKID